MFIASRTLRLALLGLSLAALCAAGASRAEPPAPRLEELPEPPPPPPPVQSGEVLEPEVTIIQKQDATVEEYRINGQLYMVKVQPAAGPAYYLMDNDGDGRMESRYGQMSDPVIPNWVLFSW